MKILSGGCPKAHVPVRVRCWGVSGSSSSTTTGSRDCVAPNNARPRHDNTWPTAKLISMPEGGTVSRSAFLYLATGLCLFI